MSKNSQNKIEIVRKKRGVAIYEKNPSIPDLDHITKKRPVRLGNATKGFVIDGVGEVVGKGVATFYEFEEVDETRFVKLFLEGVKQISGLSKTGLLVFESVYRQMQNHPNSDKVELSFDFVKKFIPDISERTYHRSLKELLDREMLFKSLVHGVFFINIRYMFNGDRLAFVKGYRRKNSLIGSDTDSDFYG